MRKSSSRSLVVLLCVVTLLAGCTSEEPKSSVNSRFQFGEKIDFNGREAHIVLDKETGIKYLYIWEGGSNGGPAITRLWEAEPGL